MNALEIIPLKVSDIKDLATQIVVSIAEGETSALKVAQTLSAMEKVVKEVKNNPVYKRVVLSEAEREDSRTFRMYGAEYQVKEVGVKYDYSNCNDTEIIDLYARREALDALIKEREAFLKAVPAAGMEIVDDATGEMMRVYPPAKSSTTSVTVIIK